MSRSTMPHRLRSAATLLAVLSLTAGCADTSNPGAPVDYREGRNIERPLPSGGVYTVQRGDTIYGIARQFNISVRALIDANSLQPPYQLTVGQVLSLSAGSDYQVVKGDTLLAISRRIGVPFSTLARMNNLQAPFVVKVGQRLKLPAGNGTAVANGSVIESPRLAQASGPMAAPPPVAPPPVAVAGDQKNGGYTTLAERDKAAEPASALAPAATPLPPPPPPEAKLASAATPAPLPSPPPKSGRGFIWPVKGEVIAEFGAAGKGVHNDGINIAVPRGTPVMAAEDGVVAYSGNELRGFGNLLLIKHADGWMTAYAHNDQLLVKRGETVKRGQKISLAGDSGGVSQPQVHFEVRQGTRAVDPMTFLRGDKVSPAASQGDPPDPG